MTLRELLEEVSYKEVFNSIYKTFLKNKKFQRSKMMDLSVQFETFFNSLKDLPIVDPKDNKIYITFISENVDVCLFDEKKDEIFALDSMDYRYIIDMEVYKAVNIDDISTVAHILKAIKS